MANRYSYQVLKDDTQHAIIKLTGDFDGTGQENNISRVAANTLYGAIATNGFLVANNQGGAANTTLPYYGLTINRLWYDSDSNVGVIQLYWANTKSTLASDGTPILFLQGNGEYDGNGNWITIKNPNVLSTATTVNNGDIAICTRGQIANSSYTIIMELRKDNAQYQRGQFNDPAAFNYPPYNLKP
jgi:hypothetical protein